MDNEFEFDQIKEQRLMDLMDRVIENPYEFTPERIGVKEKHKLLQVSRLARNHDKE
jgi:hypothetical protein